MIEFAAPDAVTDDRVVSRRHRLPVGQHARAEAGYLLHHEAAPAVLLGRKVEELEDARRDDPGADLVARDYRAMSMTSTSAPSPRERPRAGRPRGAAAGDKDVGRGASRTKPWPA